MGARSVSLIVSLLITHISVQQVDGKTVTTELREAGCKICSAVPCIHDLVCHCRRFSFGSSRACLHTASVHLAQGRTTRVLPPSVQPRSHHPPAGSGARCVKPSELAAKLRELSDKASRLQVVPADCWQLIHTLGLMFDAELLSHSEATPRTNTAPALTAQSSEFVPSPAKQGAEKAACSIPSNSENH